MTYLVAFIILTKCLLVQGHLEWKVLKKITEYGQNVTLVCNVSNCCPKSAGWDKYTPQQRTIIIDVKTWRPTKKYDGNILTDGYTLVIRNLTKQDLNISYACVYGSSQGDQQYLLEENVFDYISTTQQNGQIGNQTFSAGTIAGIILGVSAAVLVAIFIICFWKRRKERHRNTRNSIEGEERNIIKKVPEIALQESLGADKVKAEREERNIIRKEPEIALQESLCADKVKAEGEERNIIRKEPGIAFQVSLCADKVKAEGEERNVIKQEPEIALQESIGADKVKDMYEKKRGQKGLVLIVNFPFHGQVTQRSGSEVDVNNLLEFFEKELGYEVKCFTKDANKKELEDYFQEISRIYLGENSNDYHAFICVIMSHGNEKGIQTSDGVISVAEIKKPFTNKPGGKFNGKPKIFLINSSRGSRLTGTLDEPSASYALSFSSEIGSADEDTIVAYSTQLGFVSIRNVHSGSCFINAFIFVAKKTYRDEHIEDIFRNMKRELVTNSKYTYRSGKPQIPVIESTFTKKFFLVK